MGVPSRVQYSIGSWRCASVQSRRLCANNLLRAQLRNGNFSQGLDTWFFSVDNDRPWRIWSLPVHVLFEQGWLGVLAWSAFVALGLWRAARATWRNDAMAGAMLASTLGFLVIGGVASLIDSPRLLLLFLLLVWFCARSGTAAIQR